MVSESSFLLVQDEQFPNFTVTFAYIVKVNNFLFIVFVIYNIRYKYTI